MTSSGRPAASPAAKAPLDVGDPLPDRHRVPLRALPERFAAPPQPRRDASGQQQPGAAQLVGGGAEPFGDELVDDRRVRVRPEGAGGRGHDPGQLAAEPGPVGAAGAVGPGARPAPGPTRPSPPRRGRPSPGRRPAPRTRPDAPGRSRPANPPGCAARRPWQRRSAAGRRPRPGRGAGRPWPGPAGGPPARPRRARPSPRPRPRRSGRRAAPRTRRAGPRPAPPARSPTSAWARARWTLGIDR